MGCHSHLNQISFENYIGKYGSYDFYCYNNIKSVSTHWKTLQQGKLYSPFQNISWVRAIIAGEQQYANDSEQPQANYIFVVGFDKGKPVLILPFVVQSGLLGRRLAWLGESISDYNGAIIDCNNHIAFPAGFMNNILEMIHDKCPSVHAAYLIRNPATTLAKLPKSEIYSQRLTAEYSSHALALHRDWKQLFGKIRSSKSRQRLRSKLRRLKKAGNIKFCQIRGPSQRLKEATQILDWKSSQLDSNGKSNPLHANSHSSPLRTTIENALKNNDPSLRVFGLYLNGQMIAGMLAFVTRDTFYYYVTAFSDDVGKKYSAGTLLLMKTMELASRSGLTKYDFLIGDESYKSDWCDIQIPLVHYTLAFNFRGLLICQIIRSRLAIKKYLLRYPRLISFTQRNLKRIPFRRSDQSQIPAISLIQIEKLPNWNKSKVQV